MRRRDLLGAAAAAPWLAGCDGRDAQRWSARWVGVSPARGHRLRDRGTLPAAPSGAPRRAAVLVVGAGVAGLAAARAFSRRGIDDVHVLELEDEAGGNSRGHTMAGMGCPLGAHYLPLPGPQAHEVGEWLFELGLARSVAGRTIWDERHLCHSPQERLFIDGAWSDGVLPPAEPGSATLAQYRRFAAEVAAGMATLPFAMPAHRARWSDGHAALDAVTFDAWLGARGLDDARLRWYLDYACRDDFGAGSEVVSAWAGLHYFASRQGFHAPGDDEAPAEPVLTWPQGNGWLTERLATPLGERLHGGRTVLRVEEGRHGVQVLAFDEAAGRLERWQAGTVVLAVPLFVAARVVAAPPPALQAAAALRHAPWLVANLQLDAPPYPRPGAPAAWDNVAYGGTALGYVDAGHQLLRPDRRATVWTFYEALPEQDRRMLLAADPHRVAQRVLQTLAPVHPDLEAQVRQVDLVRFGHAMAVPRPGVRADAATGALAALRAARGRLRFAHADLAGYSVFEEAFTAGTEVADPAA